MFPHCSVSNLLASKKVGRAMPSWSQPSITKTSSKVLAAKTAPQALSNDPNSGSCGPNKPINFKGKTATASSKNREVGRNCWRIQQQKYEHLYLIPGTVPLETYLAWSISLGASFLVDSSVPSSSKHLEDPARFHLRHPKTSYIPNSKLPIWVFLPSDVAS